MDSTAIPSPVRYVVMEGGKLVLEIWSGDVSREDVESHSRAHLADARIADGAAALVDARSANFGVSPHDVQAVVDGLYARRQGRMKIGKCALLVNERTYDAARVYERSAAKYGVNVIIFNALDVACEWLGVDRTAVMQQVDRAKAARSHE